MTDRQTDRFLTLSPRRKAARKFLLCGEISLLLILTTASLALAQAGPTLQSATFFGGAGDQRGTGITIGGGAIYVSGNVQPENQGASDTALVLRYAIPPSPSPVWSRSFDLATNFDANFFSIASTNEGVYAGGQNFSLSKTTLGSQKDKTFLAKFAPDGSSGSGPGGSVWVTGGNLGPFFPQLSGGSVETFHSATTALEGFIYAAGGAKNSFQIPAYIIGKYDTSGGFLVAATDSSVGVNLGSSFFPGLGGSLGRGVTVLNGNIYLAGFSGWDFEGDYPYQRAAIWKYDSDLNLMWRRKDMALVGEFRGVTAFQDAIYAVGFTYTPGVSNSEDFLIEKYDETGNLVWRQVSGGPNTDVLTGVVGIGSRMFAVGYTRSQGAGGADAVILEIDPVTGATLSTSLYGGLKDDFANGVATDGTDLYVVGESRSFATPEGNQVEQNDGILLRYSLAVAPVTLTLTPASGFIGTSVTVSGSNFGETQGTSTVTFNGVSAGTATSWSDTQIVVVVPGGATTGPVVITVNGAASNSDKIYTVISDTIAPITTASATPAANGAGWNNSNVTVTLTAMDNAGGSGVASITYTLTGAQVGGGSVAGSSTSFTILAEGTTTVTYHATDIAGNSEVDKTLVIKIDKTAPTLTFGAASPTANAAGWNNTTPVTISFTAGDALSGVASTSMASPLTFAVETSGATQSVTVTDVAGNSATFTSQVVKIDTTPPTLTFGSASPAANAAGWNNTNVAVQFTAADALSGVAGTNPATSPLVLTAEGSAVTGTVTVMDVAGNSATFTSAAFKIDKTPPTLTMPTLAPSYAFDGTVTLNFSTSDGLSGVGSSQATFNGSTVTSGTTVTLTKAGTNTFTLTATDGAGNTASQSTNFSVLYNFIGFLQPILNDGSRVFLLGSTVPAKFQLTDARGALVSTATATLTVQKFSGSTSLSDPIDAMPSGGANTGDLFRFDSSSGQYIYNLSTQPLSTGTWQLQVHLDDGAVLTVLIGLK
jgi:IPT/TIG domain-containing protein